VSVSTLPIGRLACWTAIGLAGWPLWQLYQGGAMGFYEALLRFTLIALGCAWGYQWIEGLLRRYEHDAAVTEEAGKAERGSGVGGE
jgi:hypothetical protein